MSVERVRHHAFYDYPPIDRDDYAWVHPCCGGPWVERPYGHYADCPAGTDQEAAK